MGRSPQGATQLDFQNHGNLTVQNIRSGPSSYDDALLNMVTIPEIFSNLHSKLGIIATIGNEGISPAKTDAAIKIKGFIF